MTHQISVRVTTRASKNEIQPGADSTHLKAYVTVVPEKGKANSKIIELLSNYLDLPKSKIRLVRGASGREKIFNIED